MMNVKHIYRYLSRLSPVVVMSVFLLSCDLIKEDMEGCAIYLEFFYNYNMEYVDSFDPQVSTVDVFLFDADDKYLFTKHYHREELIGGNRMSLSEELSLGQYRILTVGGLSGSFRVSDGDGNALMPGLTTLDDVRITLIRESDIVSHEFPALWVGKTIDVHYSADQAVWPVYLVKNTNRFNFLLTVADGSEDVPARTSYTFGIITPEGAVYGHDNMPQVDTTVTYMPYYLASGDEPGELVQARLNTMRLLYADTYRYSLVVRDTQTGRLLWEYDLMRLLQYIKPDRRPDGSSLPMQEFLDRQSEWNIVILYKGDPGNAGAFAAIAVEINGWIIWLNDIGI